MGIEHREPTDQNPMGAVVILHVTEEGPCGLKPLFTAEELGQIAYIKEQAGGAAAREWGDAIIANRPDSEQQNA